jgi:hypothetical protein
MKAASWRREANLAPKLSAFSVIEINWIGIVGYSRGDE